MKNKKQASYIYICIGFILYTFTCKKMLIIKGLICVLLCKASTNLQWRVIVANKVRTWLFLTMYCNQSSLIMEQAIVPARGCSGRAVRTLPNFLGTMFPPLFASARRITSSAESLLPRLREEEESDDDETSFDARSNCGPSKG